MSTLLTSSLHNAKIQWENKNYFEASKSAITLPILELIAGGGYLVQTVLYLPVAVIKLPLSLLHCLIISPDSPFKKIHEELMPGITDVILLAAKACICFINIFISPIIGLINPNENYKYHLKYGLIEELNELEFPGQLQNNLEDIILDPEVKSQILSQIIYPVRHAELFEVYSDKNSTLTPGVILFGLPGCGKTFLARCIAGELKKKFIEVNLANCGTPFLHGTGNKINTLIQEAINAKGVLFLDEADSLLGKREHVQGSAGERALNGEVNILLQLIPQALSGGVIVIAATNHIESLDPAVKRDGRFGVHVELKAPNQEGRQSLFEKALKNRHAAENISYSELAEMSEGFTGATIQEVVRLAITQTISSICENHSIIASPQPPRISQETLANIIFQKRCDQDRGS